MFFLGKCASDRFGEAETLKFSQQMTFQLGEGAMHRHKETVAARRRESRVALTPRVVWAAVM